MQLLLIDDHPLFHLALRTLLADFQPAVHLYSAESGAQAQQLLQRLKPLPDLLLLDLELDDQSDGFALLDELRNQYPGLPIVALSNTGQMADVIRAIDQGAMGFIPKKAGAEEFRDALLLVVSGGIYVPAMRLSDAPLPPPPGSAPAAHGAAAPGSRSGRGPALEQLPLTARQREVLQCLLQGKPNKLIANELAISADTVKDHVAAIYRALGVNTRTQAVLAVGQMARAR